MRVCVLVCVWLCVSARQALPLLSVCRCAKEIKLLRWDVTSAQTPTLLQSPVKRSWLKSSPPLKLLLNSETQEIPSSGEKLREVEGVLSHGPLSELLVFLD